MSESAAASTLASEDLSGDALADAAEAALLAGEFAKAVGMLDRAEPTVGDPDRCAGARWMAHMMCGDFEAAWRESDAIRLRGRPDPHRFWHGEEIAGRRLILRSLHGFGDAVQMFRFLPRLRKLVSHLVVEVPPRLVELAPCFAGIGEVITWGELAPVRAPLWDVQVEVMELPYLLRVTGQDLTPCNGYLRLPAEAKARVAGLMGSSPLPRVGLVWGAGQWNTARSIPFELFRSLLDIHDVAFWSLQGDADRSAWEPERDGGLRRNVYEAGDGILPLAAVLERMDLVITVDTLAAHLAGALDVPCWLLLQHRADWRWGHAAETSSWYPSLRLWRQTAEGDWTELMARVRAALAGWATSIPGAGSPEPRLLA